MTHHQALPYRAAARLLLRSEKTISLEKQMDAFDGLVTEQRNPASARIDEKSTSELLEIINLEDAKVAAAVAGQIPQIAKAVDQIVAAMDQGGRLFYIGAGTSGRLGVLDAAECPPTFHVPPDLVQGVIAGGEPALARATEASEDDARMGWNDLRMRGFRPPDVLVGIAASGRTPYVLGAVESARAAGSLTIGISCTPGSVLSGTVDVAIEPVPGPEVITGSTRLKAGTATKLVLNMLSTGTMVRRGYVFGNLMVNVQPTNAKLARRVDQIVSEATGLPAQEAEALVQAAGGSAKRAIVMHRIGVNRMEAEQRIGRAHGVLSKVFSTEEG